MPHFRDVKRTLTQQRTEYPIKMQHAYPSVNIGWGAHTMVGNDAKALGMTNALVVTTSFLIAEVASYVSFPAKILRRMAAS